MDSVFGIGAPELLLILLLAGIVMGPQRIRQVALWLGRTTAQLQSTSRGFVRQLNAELDAVDGGGDLRDTMSEVNELRRQIKDLRREITSAAISPVQQSQNMLQESRQMLENSIKPPSNDVEQADTEEVQEETDLSAATLPNLLEVPDDPE
jgi:Sec-independent protein translocase protein TatA